MYHRGYGVQPPLCRIIDYDTGLQAYVTAYVIQCKGGEKNQGEHHTASANSTLYTAPMQYSKAVQHSAAQYSTNSS